jgi:hypothetical protein
LPQQQLRQAVTARAGPHLLRRQRREEIARLLGIDEVLQKVLGAINVMAWRIKVV